MNSSQSNNIKFRSITNGDFVYTHNTGPNAHVRLKIVKKFDNQTLLLKENSGKQHIALFCEARSRAFFDATPDSTLVPRYVVGLDKGKPVIVNLVKENDEFVIRRGLSFFKTRRDDTYPWYHIGDLIQPSSL